MHEGLMDEGLTSTPFVPRPRQQEQQQGRLPLVDVNRNQSAVGDASRGSEPVAAPRHSVMHRLHTPNVYRDDNDGDEHSSPNIFATPAIPADSYVVFSSM